MRATALLLDNQSTPPPPPPPLPQESPEAENEEGGNVSESVIKIRVDQSWNVRLLWEGRVRELLVSAGVGLGPGSSSSELPSLAGSSNSSFSSGGQSAGGGSAAGGGAASYWRSLGVSVLYSS